MSDQSQAENQEDNSQSSIEQPREKKLGRRALLALAFDGAVGLTAASLYSPFDKSLENLCAAYQSGRQITRTLKSMGMGNEAQQELARLEKELQTAEQVSGKSKALYQNKKRVASELNEIYSQNETIQRKAIKLARTIEMTLGDIGRAGEAVKTDSWRKIDDKIIDFYNKISGGKTPDAKEARKRHKKIAEYHKALRHAYRNDENMQQTVADFVKYLRTTADAAKKQNEIIDEHLPTITKYLREDYEQMHTLEDEGYKATQRMKPKIQRLEENIEELHGDLEDDGVQVRPLRSDKDITGNTYIDSVIGTSTGRHVAAGILGIGLVRGAIAMVQSYFKPVTAVAKGAYTAYKETQ